MCSQQHHLVNNDKHVLLQQAPTLPSTYHIHVCLNCRLQTGFGAQRHAGLEDS